MLNCLKDINKENSEKKTFNCFYNFLVYLFLFYFIIILFSYQSQTYKLIFSHHY